MSRCRCVVAVAVAWVLTAGGGVFAETIWVPDDYETIQGAIDAAVDGDEIVVADGTWSGPGNKDLDFLGKAIIVRSRSRDPARCIIDCEGSGRGFDLRRNEPDSARIDGFTVMNGRADIGGGLRTNGSPTIRRCIFMNNSAVIRGGGVEVDGGATVIRECVFVGNAAGGGGGGVNIRRGDAWVINCRFIANQAGYYGGGVNTGSGVVVCCVFAGNDVPLDGGGLFLYGGLAVNCIVWGNTGAGAPDEIWASGGQVQYSDVRGGFPGEGNIDTPPAFVTGPTGTWSANATYDPDAYETTFFDETASFVPGELFARSLIPNTLADANRGGIVGNSATEIRVKGNLSFLGTEGARYEIQDFRLSAGSPCIDAGDNTSVPDGIVDDLDGNPRFVDDPLTEDTGRGEPPIVDMGPYEFQGCREDLDGSGSVDFGDVLRILTAWGPCEGDCPEDLDGSGAVDFGDILAVLTAWGPCE